MVRYLKGNMGQVRPHAHGYPEIHQEAPPSVEYGHSAMEQRVNIKFCYKLRKTATGAREMLVQVYGTKAVSRRCVYDWFKRFHDGKKSPEDEPLSGRPILISKKFIF
jgi:hypothetical protein